MSLAQPQAAQEEHPRGTWFDPESRGLVGHGALMDRLAGKRAVLLGETHDVAEIHRWQLHVITALHARKPNLAVGFEMFPRSTQPVLDRWVAGELTTDGFLAAVNWYEVWGFDPELYLPIFHFCRQMGVRMLALNCYRALVTRVRLEGWDKIPEAERDGLTPSAPALPAHKAWLANLMSGMRGTPVAVDERFEGFIAAQQTWDRAFACNIAYALRGEAPPDLVVGVIGRGHLDFGYGTPHQLRDLGIPESAVLVTTTGRDKPEQALAQGIADAVFHLDRPEPSAGRPPKIGLKLDPASEAPLVSELLEDSAAVQAGVALGDRITGLAGRAVETRADYLGISRRLIPGVTVPLVVTRGGQDVTLSLTVVAPPPLGRPPA